MAKKKSRNEETPKQLGTEEAVEARLAIGGDIGAPVATQLTKKEYKQDMAGLQLDMAKVQGWVVGERLRAVVILEGLGPSGKSPDRNPLVMAITGRKKFIHLW